MAELREPLDERVMAGFGGVAEYGITVRWDKTFLKVIRLLLERRAGFAMFGGVRFGGTITLEDAFATSASITSRWRSAPGGRRCCRSPTAWRAACARPPTSSWRCSSPAPPRRTPSPTCSSACRWW